MILRAIRWRWAAALVVLCLVLPVVSLVVGAETLDMGRAWSQWRDNVPLHQAPELSILLRHRMPRTLAALLGGAGLALAGCALQALLRNPLATPYTLGVASAGSLGAWLAFLLMNAGIISTTFLGGSIVQIMAFLFAAADIMLIYVFAARGVRTSPTVLLLAGVTLGMLANAGIMLTRYLAKPHQLLMMDRWLMGGVDVLGYRPVLVLFVGVVPCAVLLLLQASKFDQFGFGLEMAAGRGVNVARLQLVTFLTASLMTAIIVSEVGPIGFVGLIVPHTVRLVTGSRHRLLMPLSVLAGGGFLCACDIVARRILPGETPIGIITTLVGAPFFLYMLTRSRLTDWES